jgi:hypothetical protein
MDHPDRRARIARFALPRAAAAAALIGTLLLHAAPAAAQSLPAPAQALLPDAHETGAGTLRYFGFLIYRAKLWAAGSRFDPESPFALGIRYARHVEGARLVRESVEQWRRMHYGLEERYQGWKNQLEHVLPDVKADDELVGLYRPGAGAQFYLNGKPTGEIADVELARAFFAIWLDPRTSQPDLRAALLGGT